MTNIFTINIFLFIQLVFYSFFFLNTYLIHKFKVFKKFNIEAFHSFILFLSYNLLISPFQKGVHFYYLKDTLIKIFKAKNLHEMKY
jgi:hypothetical protein